MPSLHTRTHASGAVSYRVMWREHGRQHARTFDNEPGAKKWLALLEAAGSDVALSALEVSGAAHARTVEEQVAAHIEHLTGIEDGTRRDYTRMAERDIYPHLGPVPLPVLSRDDVASWVNKLQRRGLAPKTIKHRHSLLSASLTSAVRDRTIPDNVAKGVRLPRVVHQEMVFLTEQEFARLLDLTPEYWRPLVMLIGATGVRFGEATALQVADVDITGRTIRVHQAWKHTDGNGYLLGPPKTTRSVRTIALPTVCSGDLVKLTSGRSPTDFVFTNTAGGPVRHQAFHAGVWQPLIHAFAGDERRIIPQAVGRPRLVWNQAGSGKRPRIHDLRHSFASWAISAGHPLTAIQRTMGHESITTTSDRYGHLFRADRDAFADLVAVPGIRPSASRVLLRTPDHGRQC